MVRVLLQCMYFECLNFILCPLVNTKIILNQECIPCRMALLKLNWYAEGFGLEFINSILKILYQNQFNY